MDEEKKAAYLQELLSKDSLNSEEINWLLENQEEVRFHLQKDFILDTQAFEAPGAAALERHQKIRHYLLNLIEQNKPLPKIPVWQRTWIQYAAAVVLILGIGIFYYQFADKKSGPAITQKVPDKAPGGDKAVLVLANGNTIELDGSSQGILATEGNSDIVKSDSGEIIYRDRGSKDASVKMNILKTPMGGQFQLQLPDGSKVWLNAASSIEYPSSFTGKERRVKVKGELFFEVAAKANIPFIVESKDMQVEVLGTAFNINCYENEDALQTTLVNGKVKVIAGGESKLLNPGQQAALGLSGATDQPGKLQVVSQVNIDKVVAWKSGLFNFDGADLFNVMRQLERWYNIKVQYASHVQNIRFKGKMYRNTNLSNVLQMLTLMEVDYEFKNDVLYLK